MAASTDGTDAPSTPPPSSSHQPIQDAESPIHDQGRSTGMPAGEGSTLPPLSESQAHASSDAQHDDKILQILAACQNKDCAALKALATSGGGLVDDRTRRAAWPVLLGCGAHAEDQPAWQDLKRHRDEEQVALDVHRSFIYYPNEESDSRIASRKLELSNLITEVLRRHDYLCYFQGYHDIVQVMLLVMGASAAVPIVERLSVLRIRDFMLPTLTASLSHLSLLPAILAAADPQLYAHLNQTAPFTFALSATLTLYAHDIQEYGDIARLFDFLLANEAVISIYLFAQIICSRKKELLELEAEDGDMMHSILSKLPQPLDLDGLIRRATELFRHHPPERLSGFAWYHISSYSVLKTARDPAQLARQSLSDGEHYFVQQATEIKRHDARKRQLQQARRLLVQYRRPALTTTAALAVAVLALYMRRSDHGLQQSFVGEWGARLLLACRRLVQ